MESWRWDEKALGKFVLFFEIKSSNLPSLQFETSLLGCHPWGKCFQGCRGFFCCNTVSDHWNKLAARLSGSAVSSSVNASMSKMWWLLHMVITAHISRQSPLKGVHGCTWLFTQKVKKEDVWKQERELDRKVQTFHTFSPPHTWTVHTLFSTLWNQQSNKHTQARPF